MKKFNLIFLLRKYKKIFLGIFAVLILKIFATIFSFLYDTNFYIHNYVNADISYINAETSSSEDSDFTRKELDSMLVEYELIKNKKVTRKFNRRYWNKKDREFSLSFFTIDEKNLSRVIFIDKPKHPNQKPSCSFKIEVYPDKVIVTPTYKRFCKKPMYYYKNFNPYDVQNSSG